MYSGSPRSQQQQKENKNAHHWPQPNDLQQKQVPSRVRSNRSHKPHNFIELPTALENKQEPTVANLDEAQTYKWILPLLLSVKGS
mmetsp:Transcript_3654/g.8407  ORF Transcript_3654/g.8407 Transcript_3654/m.8407 type:complete len:85 (+) Transcript_3654:3015-3269(+)